MSDWLQGEKGEPGPQGPPPSWWYTLLMQLPAILTALAGCIGAWAAYSASTSNRSILEQHGTTIDKVETDVGQVKRVVGAIQSKQEDRSRGP